MIAIQEKARRGLRSTAVFGLLAGLALGLDPTGASAADRDQRTEIPAAVTRDVRFGKDVRPLLAARCGGCHMNGKKSGGFGMDTRESFLKGGDSGAGGRDRQERRQPARQARRGAAARQPHAAAGRRRARY